MLLFEFILLIVACVNLIPDFFAVQSTHFLKLSFQKDLHGLLVINFQNIFSNPDPKTSRDDCIFTYMKHHKNEA